MHIIPGLQADQRSRILQATRSACGPLTGIAPIEHVPSKGYDTHWARSCIEFNEDVMAHLARTPSITTVVLSSPLRTYLGGDAFDVLVERQGGYRQIPPDANLALQHLSATIMRIRALGRRVVLIAPPPSSNFNIGACLERLQEGKLILGAPNDCVIDEDDYRRRRSNVLELLERLSGAAKVNVIRFDPLLCNGTHCRTSIEGTALYRDSGHLSIAGSRLLGQRIGLLDQVERLAR